MVITIKTEMIKKIDAHQRDFIMMEISKHWLIAPAGKADGRKARERKKNVGGGENQIVERRLTFWFEKQRWPAARWLGVH